jgi:hypothetical protein
MDRGAEAAEFPRDKLRARASRTRPRDAAYRVINASAIAMPFIETELSIDQSLE